MAHFDNKKKERMRVGEAIRGDGGIRSGETGEEEKGREL